MSDSGGVQEEAALLHRPVLVVRRSTERPEVLGTVARLVSDVEEIAPAAHDLVIEGDARRAAIATLPCPYGDGTAGERIAEAVRVMLAGSAGAA